jgi:hypothetical protein
MGKLCLVESTPGGKANREKRFHFLNSRATSNLAIIAQKLFGCEDKEKQNPPPGPTPPHLRQTLFQNQSNSVQKKADGPLKCTYVC